LLFESFATFSHTPEYCCKQTNKATGMATIRWYKQAASRPKLGLAKFKQLWLHSYAKEVGRSLKDPIPA